MTEAVQAGFADAARDSQAVFRVVMDAMARPARILPLPSQLKPPQPLLPEMAVLLLTLADFDTPLWLDPPLAAGPDVAGYLRFHTGARVVREPAGAVFAAIADPLHMPPLSAFAQGEPDYPDRSATLLLQVGALSPQGWTFTGPGIQDRISFAAAPLPAKFAAQLAANRQAFPLGVDVIFAARGSIAALPRSVRIQEAV